MNLLQGFRDPNSARFLIAALGNLGEQLRKTGTKVRIMEVCGTHTMAIARYGLKNHLPEDVILTSGPGCPVCVTSPGYIDAAVALARPDTIIVTFGDMMRVPGSRFSLADARARGADVRVCYSPLDAIRLAREFPHKEVIFLAIGFETTTVPIVAMLDAALAQGIENLSLFTALKCVPPAISALIQDKEIQVNAFLCPGHVSVIIGADAYGFVAEQHHIPCVVAGFEPLDILQGLQSLLQQHIDKQARVENLYSRAVRPQGNTKAQAIISRYMQPADANWRGIGVIPQSGLVLRKAFQPFDSQIRFGLNVESGKIPAKCLCGDVLKGKTTPPQCTLFGDACTPDHPIGPCMVSSEGACAADYKYAD